MLCARTPTRHCHSPTGDKVDMIDAPLPLVPMHQSPIWPCKCGGIIADRQNRCQRGLGWGIDTSTGQLRGGGESKLAKSGVSKEQTRRRRLKCWWRLSVCVWMDAARALSAAIDLFGRRRCHPSIHPSVRAPIYPAIYKAYKAECARRIRLHQRRGRQTVRVSQ